MKVKKIKRILEEALLDMTSDVDGADCLLFSDEYETVGARISRAVEKIEALRDRLEVKGFEHMVQEIDTFLEPMKTVVAPMSEFHPDEWVGEINSMVDRLNTTMACGVKRFRSVPKSDPAPDPRFKNVRLTFHTFNDPATGRKGIGASPVPDGWFADEEEIMDMKQDRNLKYGGIATMLFPIPKTHRALVSGQDAIIEPVTETSDNARFNALVADVAKALSLPVNEDLGIPYPASETPASRPERGEADLCSDPRYPHHPEPHNHAPAVPAAPERVNHSLDTMKAMDAAPVNGWGSLDAAKVSLDNPGMGRPVMVMPDDLRKLLRIAEGRDNELVRKYGVALYQNEADFVDEGTHIIPEPDAKVGGLHGLMNAMKRATSTMAAKANPKPEVEKD